MPTPLLDVLLVRVDRDMRLYQSGLRPTLLLCCDRPLGFGYMRRLGREWASNLSADFTLLIGDVNVVAVDDREPPQQLQIQ